MCLSKVYMKKKTDGSVVVEEASRVTVNEGAIEVQTLFGEVKVLPGYFIREVDLLKNSIVLEERG
ncbi:MAG TPA: CooT family nickel-binding protein [Spirochaetes bacterium]|nr:CooT family nickel-binding protein [Spirochaetota bacterium]